MNHNIYVRHLLFLALSALGIYVPYVLVCVAGIVTLHKSKKINDMRYGRATEDLIYNKIHFVWRRCFSLAGVRNNFVFSPSLMSKPYLAINQL